MTELSIKHLSDELPFGARIVGATLECLKEGNVQRTIRDAFEDRGVIVFEDVEPTADMQVAISTVIGPLKDHPVKLVERADEKRLPGVITIRNGPDACIVEIDGVRLATWQPWHFDHSYNDELNRAGVLRSETIADKGGRTAFADGIQIYADLSPDARLELDGVEVLYTLDLRYEKQWFGLPAGFREIRPKDGKIAEFAKTMPRAIHPAIWTRKTGQKVVHLSPYGARGIVGDETPKGNAKLARLWSEVEAVIRPYFHEWKPRDMVVWDNWRMLHQACGCDPNSPRVVHRTTIKGDYGLGRWEQPQVTQPSVAEAM